MSSAHLCIYTHTKQQINFEYFRFRNSRVFTRVHTHTRTYTRVYTREIVETVSEHFSVARIPCLVFSIGVYRFCKDNSHFSFRSSTTRRRRRRR